MTTAQDFLDSWPDAIKAELIIQGHCRGCLTHPAIKQHLPGCKIDKKHQEQQRYDREFLEKMISIKSTNKSI